MAKLKINGQLVEVTVDGSTPLLWVLREHLGLTGTKYSCGIGLCGSCTVHIDGEAARACVVAVSELEEGQDIVTIEGLSENDDHPVQQAWAELDVPQCGYCQPGMIMTAAALLAKNPDPSDADIDATMTNICRCGTFNRVRRGIHLAVEIEQEREVVMSKERINVSRREFLIRSGAAGAGFALGLTVPLIGRTASAAEGSSAADAEVPEINAWVVIQPDDAVIIRIARSEMGQGTLTGLAQLVAEELECDWSKVTTEYPTPGENLRRDRVWGSFSTGGSRGIRESHLYVRKGGAVARQMLIEAAADAWGVPHERVPRREQRHHPCARRAQTTSYGKVAKAAAELWPPEQVELKDPKDWKLIGQPVKRLDTVDKLNGKQVFGADLQLPGMLNAAIKACPVFTGKLKSFDAAKVRQDARRASGGGRRGQCRGRGRRDLVAGQDRAGRAARHLG